MTTDFDHRQLLGLVERQLSSFFPLCPAEVDAVSATVPMAMERTEVCIAGVDNKYFHRDGQILFSPFHSGQWLIFLYYLSNTISTLSDLTLAPGLGSVKSLKLLADKIYYLNKIMHSVDIYHEVALPSTFFLEHPVGTVLGRADYKDGFMAYQGCTVGGNKGFYPVLGRNFRMMSGSKVLGHSRIGDNVTLAANAYVKDTDIPDGATVFGQYPDLSVKFLK